MRTVCAWCGSVMTDGDPPVSHGMCSSCRNSFDMHEGVSLQDFIDGFAFPVLVLNNALEPVGMNQHGAESARWSPDDLANSSIGAIVECEHSKLPEACGQTIHCSGCVLRRTVRETNQTGEPFCKVPAKLTIHSTEVSMYVSTLKLDGRIFVKLEKAKG